MPEFVKLGCAVGFVILFSAIWSEPAAAQRPDRSEAGTLRDVELPIPAPMILPDQAGQRAVFVQWFSEGFQWRDEKFEQPVVRIAVVNLEEMSVMATSEL